METRALFHKGRNRLWKRLFIAGVLLALFSIRVQPVCYAQEPAVQDGRDRSGQEGQPPDEAVQGKYGTHDLLQPEPAPEQLRDGAGSEPNGEMAIPVPIAPLNENESLGGRAFVEDVFRNSRNRWGFSLSAYQAYTSDIASDDQPKQSSGITAFRPSIFFNFGKRKSKFHLDLGAGYRHYNKRRQPNVWDYHGGFDYSLLISKRTSFRVADQFNSSFNDAWSFLSLSSPLNYDLLSSNEVLFNRQRINRNSIRAEIAQQLTTKARLGIFGGHRWYDYRKNTLNNSSAIEFGGSFDYQLKKWLYIASSATVYVNLAEAGFSDARIYHVQFGGLDFRLTDSWRIWAGGGIDVSDYESENRIAEHVSAGIEYTTVNTTFNVTYQRGFTSAIGISRLLLSDVASASFGRRMNNWISARLESYYYKSSEAGLGGSLKTFSSGGALEFSLSRNLVLTMNAYYQNQQTRNFSVQGLGLNRLTGYLGLQYIWPARKRGEY